MNAFVLLKILHVLSAAVWVGGMVFAVLVLRPSLAVLEPAQRIALHTQVFRRFFLIVWHAMPLLLVTGYAMIMLYLGGMAGVRWPIHLMLTAGLAMAIIFVVIFFGPYRRFQAATAVAEKAAAAELIRKLITVNLVLGLLTIAVAELG